MAGSAPWAWSLGRVHAALRQPGALAFLHCCAAAAVYACVPETDQMKGVGLLVVGLLVLEVVAGERLPLGWHGVVAATVVWAGVFGSSGRGSALIGATFAVWPILLPALFGASAAVCMLGVAGAWLSSRTGAIQPDTAPAVVGVAAWGGATSVGAVLVWFRVGRRSNPYE